MRVRATRWVLVVAAGVALLGLAVPASAATGPEPPLQLALSTAKSAYAVGDHVTVAAQVTNRGADRCVLASIPDGSLHITGITRDGIRLDPEPGATHYLDGLDAAIRTSLTAVEPGRGLTVATVAYRPSADGVAMRLASVDGTPAGVGLTATWDVGAPGTYELTALYALPAFAGRPADTCAGPSPVAAVKFTVAAPASGVPIWVLAAGTAGLLLGIGALFAAWTRRRSRLPAATVVVAVLVSGSVLLDGGSPAVAEIVVPDTAVNAVVEGCMTQFRANGDPGGVAARASDLNLPPIEIVGIETDEHGAGTRTDPIDESDPAKGSRIQWNPNLTTFTLFGAEFTNCVALYHELQHALDFRDQEYLAFKGSMCKGVPLSDVHAVEAENALRPKVGLPPRTSYHGVVLPPFSYAECLKKLKANRSHENGVNHDDGDVSDPTNPQSGDSSSSGGGTGGTGEDARPGDSGSSSGNGGGSRPADSSGSGLGDDVPGLPSEGGGAGAGSGGSGGSGGGAGSGGGDSGRTPGRAWGFGDPHLFTTDGLLYDFQAAGEFVAVQGAGLDVHLRLQPLPDTRTVSAVTAVAVRAGERRAAWVLHDGALAFTVDGRPPEAGDGAPFGTGSSITPRESALAYGGVPGYTVRWPDGSALYVDATAYWGIRVGFTPAAGRRGAIAGLLGNFDGDAADDLTPRGGSRPVAADSATAAAHDDFYRSFGDSWRVTTTESAFDYQPGESTDTFTDRSFPDRRLVAADLNADQRRRGLLACTLAGVGSGALLDACMLDVALTGQPTFAITASDIAREAPAVAAVAAVGPATGPAASSSDLRPDATIDGTEGDHVFSAKAGDVAFFRSEECRSASYATHTWTVRAVDGSLGEYHGIVDTCTDLGRVSFTTDGTYKIVVAGPGPFRLTWVAVPPDQRLPLLVGQEVTGRLDVPGATHLYTFAVRAGQVLTFRPAPGCVDAGVQWDVLTSDGATEGRGISGTCSAIGPITFTHDGDYLLHIASAGRAAVGPYRFTATSG